MSTEKTEVYSKSIGYLVIVNISYSKLCSAVIIDHSKKANAHILFISHHLLRFHSCGPILFYFLQSIRWNNHLHSTPGRATRTKVPDFGAYPRGESKDLAHS